MTDRYTINSQISQGWENGWFSCSLHREVEGRNITASLFANKSQRKVRAAELKLTDTWPKEEIAKTNLKLVTWEHEQKDTIPMMNGASSESLCHFKQARLKFGPDRSDKLTRQLRYGVPAICMPTQIYRVNDQFPLTTRGSYLSIVRSIWIILYVSIFVEASGNAASNAVHCVTSSPWKFKTWYLNTSAAQLEFAKDRTQLLTRVYFVMPKTSP